MRLYFVKEFFQSLIWKSVLRISLVVVDWFLLFLGQDVLGWLFDVTLKFFPP